MMPIYSTDVKTLSDAELVTLMKEIEDAGWAYGDGDDCGDDAAQASNRFYEMECEVTRRWELANPEEAARRHASYWSASGVIAAQLKAISERMASHFTESPLITEMMRTGRVDSPSPLHFRIPFKVSE